MEMLRTSWIYSLKLDDLVPHFWEFNLDTNGTVEELRKRLAEFVSCTHDDEVTTYLMALQEKYENLNTSSVPICTHAGTNSNMIDEIKKWELSYDGSTSPLPFIDDLKELAEIYGTPLNKLPKFMPLFLSKRALVWFRNNNAHWQEWRRFKTDFLAFFLPSNHLEKLETQICGRVQRSNEVFKDYVLAIQSLMRHTNMTEEQKLDRILRNSRILYQCYIKRKDFSTLTELIRLAENFETYKEPSLQLNCPPRRTEPTTVDISERKRKFSISQTSLKSSESKLISAFLMAGKWVTAVINTGASANFIAREFIRSLNIDPSFAKVEMNAVFADGSFMPVLAAVDFPTSLGGITKKCRFLVINEAKEDLVVGLDFLRQFNASMELAGLNLNFGNLEATPSCTISKPLLLPHGPTSSAPAISNNIAVSSSLTKAEASTSIYNPLSRPSSAERQVSSPTTNKFKFDADYASLPEELQRHIEQVQANWSFGTRKKFVRCVNEIVYRVTISRNGFVNVAKKPPTTTLSSEASTLNSVLSNSSTGPTEECISVPNLSSSSLTNAEVPDSVVVSPATTLTTTEEFMSPVIPITSAPSIAADEPTTSPNIQPTSASTIPEVPKPVKGNSGVLFEGDFSSLPMELQLHVKTMQENWKRGTQSRVRRSFENNMYRLNLTRRGVIRVYNLGEICQEGNLS